MLDFEKRLQSIGAQTILCVGDLMLDDFVYGEVARISPEAPAPVLAVKRNEIAIGGAGNVARNVASLGARCIFVGLIGDDAPGRDVIARLQADPLIEPSLVIDASRPTTRKVRFVSEHFSTHLLRADWEQAGPVSAEREGELLARALAALPRVGAIVLSDYAKGVLTPRILAEVIAAAREAGIPVIVDPKAADYAVYRGATIIKPNRKELAETTRMPVGSDDEVIAAATRLNASLGTKAVLVSLSDEGLVLVPADGAPIRVPAFPVKVKDASGAGDTVVAALALMLATHADYEVAVRVANAAGAIVVGKRGTATVSVDELRHQILPASTLASEDKVIYDRAVLDERLAAWRRARLRIGFTNGCFDLLHRGHVKLMAEARAHCDRLVVGLNSDASVRRLKGPQRPIQDVVSRAEVLAALEAVDLVVVFEEDTPLELIRLVRPAVLVKGGDYTRDQVVGHDVVEANGGVVILVDLVPGHSTTSMVARSRS
ncbi:MAG TPA: D-glycero-beta-D-manno-heptose-7-phosphate kinase [Xanthobacteraceae bacterium]|nr:D-glycero-beta-D-manno-heptose-7-phosphate kinase [Xanthobacteraceae bacterium]